MEFSREMVRKLLETQQALQREKPEMSLISLDELREIRRIWLLERQDWEIVCHKFMRQSQGKALNGS